MLPAYAGGLGNCAYQLAQSNFDGLDASLLSAELQSKSCISFDFAALQVDTHVHNRRSSVHSAFEKPISYCNFKQLQHHIFSGLSEPEYY